MRLAGCTFPLAFDPIFFTHSSKDWGAETISSFVFGPLTSISNSLTIIS